MFDNLNFMNFKNQQKFANFKNFKNLLKNYIFAIFTQHNTQSDITFCQNVSLGSKLLFMHSSALSLSVTMQENNDY